MASVQSRLPIPSLKKVEKQTTNPTITSRLRNPTPISTSLTAPSSKQVIPTKQEEKIPSKTGSSPVNTTSISPKIMIPTKKLDFTHVKSRVGSLDNAKHKPKGGEIKIYSEKPNFSNVKSRIGSLENMKHKPNTSKVEVVKKMTLETDFSNVKSRVGSFDNVKHVPKGGDVRIFSSKPNLKNVHSRVGSLDNINHIPKGGDKVIFNDKLNLSNVKPRVGSLDNIRHVPKGGEIKIFDEKLKFKEFATPKIISRSSTTSSNGSLDDDDILSLVDSPISSLALEDSPEIAYNPPSQEAYTNNSSLIPHMPTMDVLSPIMEHFEEGIHEEEEEEVEEVEMQSSIHVNMVETESSFEVHDLLQKQKNSNEETNKHTEFSFEKETNSVYEVQDFSGNETHYQRHENDYEEDYDDQEDYSQGESTLTRESTIFVTNNSLNDADLSFEVNVLRKSTLLSNTERNSIEFVNVESLKGLIPTIEIPPIEIPPKIEHEYHKPGLTITQQRVYDESWI